MKNAGGNTADGALARQALIAALSAVARGDRDALREVYQQTSSKLFGICVRICGEQEGAEDVLQEVFITIWARSSGYDPERASPITWLATIAHNKAIDWKRRQPKAPTIPDAALAAIADPAPLAFDYASETQQADRLHGCLDGLEPRTSHAIRAAFLDGATYADLAGRANVPLGTMKSWIRRGLQQLKACLGDG